MPDFRKKPQRSLRTILIIWFLLFSVVPLAFVTGYSVIKYEMAIDHELSQRLRDNAREIAVIISDYQTGMKQRREKYLIDAAMLYHLSTENSGALLGLATPWMKSDFSSSLTFFNRDGRMLISLFKDEAGDVRHFTPAPSSSIYLSDQNLQKLKQNNESLFAEFSDTGKLSLIVTAKAYAATGRHVGYIEQIIDLDKNFLNKLKERLKLELFFMRPEGQIVTASHADFSLYPKNYFVEYVNGQKEPFFDLNIRNNPYGFLIYPMNWGESKFFLGLGASKVEAREVLKNVNYAFYTVVGTVILLLIVTIVVTSNVVLKPLYELVDGIQNIHDSDKPVEIPIKNDTEIGLLTENFNEMSRRIIQARSELKNKISELETTNLDLKEAQAKLVHAAKMASLGQLVAGVAHELNNPIGFIYSNMAHLRDYANRLTQFAQIAEKSPEETAKKREELEIDYILDDLPKLIASCEDGARRIKDIVLGLRNFSRLEEAKLKEVDLHEGLDNTINLLSGETKNRIEIHKEYGDLSKVTCYASQINQVFMNILSNAVQAIDGSGHIWVKTSLGKDAKGVECACIKIQDSGKGIPAATLEKVFDPFFTTKTVGQGTGLGLSITYGIVQSHGGDIQVQSEVGKGTEFTILLPLRSSVESST